MGLENYIRIPFGVNVAAVSTNSTNITSKAMRVAITVTVVYSLCVTKDVKDGTEMPPGAPATVTMRLYGCHLHKRTSSAFTA